MSKQRELRRPAGVKAHPARSFRAPDSVWDKAKRRAAMENATMSHVMLSLLEAYAEGYVKLPERRTLYSAMTVPQEEAN